MPRFSTDSNRRNPRRWVNFFSTIRAALGSGTVRVIDVHLLRDGMSTQLANMSSELARLRGATR